MSERCPLDGMVWSSDIPEFCFTQCERLWEEAIEKDRIHGEYDAFPYQSSCATHETGSLESDDMSLQVTVPRSNLRIVGILDICGGCGEEYGAQSFKFICPEE